MKQILVDGEPTNVHMDDTHIYGGGGILGSDENDGSFTEGETRRTCSGCGSVIYGNDNGCCTFCGDFMLDGSSPEEE